MYPDFVHRFIIIKPKEVHAAMPDLKESTKIILSSIEAMNDKWRLGTLRCSSELELSDVLKKPERNVSRQSSIISKALVEDTTAEWSTRS